MVITTNQVLPAGNEGVESVDIAMKDWPSFCEACSKQLSGPKQLLEHQAGKLHKQKIKELELAEAEEEERGGNGAVEERDQEEEEQPLLCRNWTSRRHLIIAHMSIYGNNH